MGDPVPPPPPDPHHEHPYWDFADHACLHVDVVGDGLALVAAIRAFPADDVLVLVGPDREVIGAVGDPCDAMLAGLRRLTEPGPDPPLREVVLASRRASGWDPPTAVDVAEFLTRRAHLESQGVGLLDWIHVDVRTGLFRSLALVVDEEDAWHRPLPRA